MCATGVTGEVTAHAKNNLATWMLEHPLEAGEEEGAATAASAAASSSSRVDSSSDTESPFPESRRRLRSYDSRGTGIRQVEPAFILEIQLNTRCRFILCSLVVYR